MLRYFHKVSIARKVVDSWVLKPTRVRYLATISQRMNRPKVLVTRGDIPKSAISILEEKYTYFPRVSMLYIFNV